MATYAELTARYEALERGGGDKWRFRQEHEKWWENYQRNQAGKRDPSQPPPGEGPIVGPVAGSPGTPEVPPGAPPAPTNPLPEGWTWTWNGTQWVPAEGASATPEKPAYSPGAGFEWTWDEDTGDWKATRINQQQYDNDLFALYKDTLAQFGFSGEGYSDFLKQAVKEDWNESVFKIKMRASDWYLANPLYAANIARSKAGGEFLSEGEILGYADSARQLATFYGFKPPSDAYIAMSIKGGMSPAEFEHRLKVQDRINQFGGGVSMVYKALMGSDPTDEDLYEIFDPEVSTKEFDDRAVAAEMRGRPLLLGLGIRSAEEQKALEMLGVTAEQAWTGYQKLADALPQVSKLAAIDQAIANDPNNPFDSFGALFQSVFNPSGPGGIKAQEEILLSFAREQARFRQGGAPVGQQGQLVGLLNPEQRQSFG